MDLLCLCVFEIFMRASNSDVLKKLNALREQIGGLREWFSF